MSCGGRRRKALDFGAKTDAAIGVRLVADVDHASPALRFLNVTFVHLGGQAKRSFDGHADLQGRRGSKIESAARDIESFGEVLGFVRSEASRPKTDRGAKGVANELAAFRKVHGWDPHPPEGHEDITTPGEGWIKRNRRDGRVKA